MGPKAFKMHNAITSYVNNESKEMMRSRAAKAYTQYQIYSEKSIKNLL